MATQKQKKIDLDIQQDVLRELAWDTRVSPKEVGVALEGVVPHWSQRADAEAAVAHLTGVRRVLNHIVVEPAVEASPS